MLRIAFTVTWTAPCHMLPRMGSVNCIAMALIPLVMSAVVAMALGQAIVEPINERLKNLIRPHLRDDVPGVPPGLMGAVERLVFAPAFYLAPIAAAAGALVWLGLKMAANWEHSPVNDPAYPNLTLVHRRHSVRALLMGFISLAVAAASGLFFHKIAAFVERGSIQLCELQQTRAFALPSFTSAVGAW